MSIIIPVLTEFNDKGLKAGMAMLKKLGGAQLAAAVSAGALADAARRSIQAANEDARSQQVLARALQNTTNASDYQIAVIEKNLNALQFQAAVADDELRPALTKLVGATKDAAKAQDLLKTALDISAFTGKDLETVSLALGKAYNGNIGALRRLGLNITDSTVKSKDFAQAMREVTPVVEGANEAANKGAQGGWKRLGIALGELSESVGQELNQNLSDTVGILGKLARETGLVQKDQDLLGKSFKLVSDAITLGAGAAVKNFNDSLSKTREELAKTRSSLDSSAAKFRMFEESSMRAYNDMIAKRQKAYNERLAEQRKKAEAAAKANKERLADALKTAQDRLEAVKDAADGYNQSLQDTIRGYVSLSNAVQVANDSEDAYNQALIERRDAYAELARLQAVVFDAATGETFTASAEDLAAAMERVRLAEEGVTAAQGKRTDYTTQFKAQIEAAKQFAGTLQQLIGKGLTDIGLQQLLNLGPVAGAQVAQDILNGTAGLGVSDLNLSGLQGAAAGLGGTAANAMYGSQIAAAQGAVSTIQQGQQINITVTSADPDKVVEAIVKWSKKNGKLPAAIKTA